MARRLGSSRLLVLVLVLVLAGCGGPAPRTPPVVANQGGTGAGLGPPAPMTGSYTRPHSVMMVCTDDGWCEEQVHDRMEIREGGEGKLAVSIELVQSNAHTCSFEGTLVPDAAAEPPLRRWVFEQADEGDGPCKLVLEQSGEEVRLASEGCRYYCGARASLDATFRFPPAPR